MNKWATAAVFYLAVVIVGYNIYSDWWATKEQPDSQGHVVEENANHSNKAEETHNTKGAENTSNSNEENESSHAHGSDTGHEDAASNEVNAYIQNDQEQIRIFLKDKTGNPVDELEVSHEKIFHLIIVDDHLEKYYHVHPDRIGKGVFSIEIKLPDGFYKAFVDIKPKNLGYEISPVSFIVGNPSVDTHNHELVPDKTLTQTIDGETVKLTMSSFEANKPVILSFELDQTNLTPYLGAMGHVVILDENGKDFLHVHPSNDKEPLFETQFDKPGIYKVWAEFKQNGKVRAFPFVVEIK